MRRTLTGPVMGSFDLPDHYKRTLSILLQAASEGCLSLHTVPIEGRDIRDDPIVTEHALQQVLIDMIPTRVRIIFVPYLLGFYEGFP